jgi:hypothetical protein
MLKHCVYLLDSTFGVHLFNIPQKLDHSNKKNRGFAHTPKKMLTISTIEKVKAPKRHAKYRFLSVNQSYSHPPDLMVLTENCMGMHH